MPSKAQTKRVPLSALRFDAECEFLSDAPRGDPQRVPVRILARSGEPIEHPWWGKIIHDLSGMKLRKPRLQLDWCHWEWESVGYADGFDVSSGDLIVTGELVSTHEGDEASRIIAKGQAGIPYEASIDFNGPGLRLEELGPDTSAVVNGRTIEGPAVIVREWPLRSVAICPYGADHNSQSEFSETNGGEIDVTISQFTEDLKMNKKLAAALNAAIKKLTAKEKKVTPAMKKNLTANLAKAAGVTVKEMTAILAGGGSAVSKAVAAKRLAAWAKVLKTPIATFKAAAAEDEKAKKLADEKKEQEGEDDEELEDEEEMEDDEELEDEEEMEDDEELEDEEEMEDDEELEDEEEMDEKEQSAKSKKGKQLSADRQELKRFIKAFGAKYGPLWFANGKSFAQAQQLHAKRMEKLAKAQFAENKKLRRKLAAADTGEEDPVAFNDGTGSKDAKKLAQLETKVGTNLARFAAGVKLPGRKQK